MCDDAGMSSGGDLVAFVSARLVDDEAVAREAAGLTECWLAEEPAIGVVLVDGEPLIEGHITGLTAHIARHDPARTFREVAAKRAILAEHGPANGGRDAGRCRVCTAIADTGMEHRHATRFRAPCPTLLFLAATWSDHPDYAALLSR